MTLLDAIEFLKKYRTLTYTQTIFKDPKYVEGYEHAIYVLECLLNAEIDNMEREYHGDPEEA